MADGLKFGTSGLRGLVSELLGGPAGDYSLAFLRTMREKGEPSRTVLIGRDLRASSPAIAADCANAARAAGFAAVDCGALPTPALALAAVERGCPAIMVTGSHIPEDRNGLKFYRPDGEIDKADEAAIVAAHRPGAVLPDPQEAPFDGAALERYAARYREAFGPASLKGLRIGVYQQSSVARDLLAGLLGDLGAVVEALGRAERFIPVDTEAHRPEDVELIAEWGGAGRFDAIVSTDGDADRPLIADETGAILRGDVVGLLTAGFLRADTIVTPVTSGSVVERCGIASRVLRTRVGSPFVVAGMETAAGEGAAGIVGFEANGGVLLGSEFALSGGGRLAALPTRDAVLPILAVLSSIREGGRLSAVVSALKPGHALAHRLQDIPAETSRPFLERLAGDEAFRSTFTAEAGGAATVDALDGVRMILRDGSVLHYRASGNAPELRCYVEAADADRASALLEWGLREAGRALSGPRQPVA